MKNELFQYLLFKIMIVQIYRNKHFLNNETKIIRFKVLKVNNFK
jgi:hypothetical protein